MSHWKQAIACGLLLWAAGCGDDSGDSDLVPDVDSGPTPDAASTPDAAAPDAMPALTGLDAVCDEQGAYPVLIARIFDCVASGPVWRAFLGDTLGAAPMENICRGDFGAYVDDGSVMIDDTVLSACLNHIATADCYRIDFQTLSQGPCAGLVGGTSAPGSECERTEQCMGDAYCSSDGPLPAGDEPGCSVCVARLANGEDCTSDVQCTSGFCGEATCTAMADLGEACITDGCVGLLQCDEDTSLCVLPAAPSAGDACADIATDCGLPQNSGLYCDEDAGECVELPALGAACGPAPDARGPLCNYLAYEWCDSEDSLCKAPLAAADGEACHTYPTEASGARRCGAGLACSNPFNPDPVVSPVGLCYVPGLVNDACGGDGDAACHPFLSCSDVTMTCEASEYSGMCPAPPA